jgi:hypothetical protein
MITMMWTGAMLARERASGSLSTSRRENRTTRIKMGCGAMARAVSELLSGHGGLGGGFRRPGGKYAWTIPRPLLVSFHLGARAAGSALGPAAFLHQ